MSFTDIANSIFTAVRTKEAHKPICPSIDYIRKNTTAYISMQKEFYNPQVQEALSCLVRTATKDFVIPIAENPKEVAEDLATSLRQFFDTAEDAARHLIIRTINPSSEVSSYEDQIKELLVEGYAGIVFLNDLRSVTPSFKYIYAMLNCNMPKRDEQGHLVNICLNNGTTPYLVEESLETAMPLRVALNELPADEIGVRAVKSIILQLFTAVRYAAQENISNFPMEFKVRKVDPDAAIPIHTKNGKKYISTYGYVPVFERYNTVAVPLGNEVFGTPKALQQEQDDIAEYIMTTLAAVNPKLREIFPCGEPATMEFFSDVLQDSAKGKVVLTCENGKQCKSLKEYLHYFTVPYSRLDAYVRSMVERIDELRSMLEVARQPDEDFLISGVMIDYAQTLNTVAGQVSNEIRRELFPAERYFRPGISLSRYIDVTQGIIRPDLQFVQESLALNYIEYSDPNYLKESLDVAINTGYQLRNSQRDLPLPDVSSLEGISNSIEAIRDLITHINYYSTTNALIEKYRNYVGDYYPDLSEAIQEAQFLKERYDNLFTDNPGVLAKYLDSVDNDFEYILAHLYDVFIEDLPDYIETSMRGYGARRTPEELEALQNQIYIEKLLASDPIPLIIPSSVAVNVIPLAQ